MDVLDVAKKGPLSLFDIIPGWVWALICVAIGSWAVVNDVRVQHAKMENFKIAKEFSDYRAESEKEARALSERYRELEQGFQRVKEKVDVQVTEERSKTAAAVADAAGAHRLRIEATRQLAALRGSPSDPQALARAEQRASAFGQLLERCDAVAENLGRDTEDLATQVRGLQRQYASVASGSVSGGLQPLPDGDEVDPHVAAFGHGYVDATLPVPTLYTQFHRDLGFFRRE